MERRTGLRGHSGSGSLYRPWSLAGHVLEGARLEADSVIGFREEGDRWERIALSVDAVRHLEVKKLNVELTALAVGSSAALTVLGLIVGQ